MLRSFNIRFLVKSLIFLKYSLESTPIGGMHINPITSKFNFLQYKNKFSQLSTSTPDFDFLSNIDL